MIRPPLVAPLVERMAGGEQRAVPPSASVVALRAGKAGAVNRRAIDGALGHPGAAAIDASAG
ncbi:hypothetical protein ACSRUE_37175 [Sorangium sp. KYC3313]|uniref:hypothetical protein n=1 Tax=Sorangium sp. KYC3313 TaxID=3449740 RepID=UPI003F8B03AC